MTPDSDGALFSSSTTIMARVSQRLFFAVLVASTAIATPLSTSYNYNVERSSLTLAPLVAEYHPHGTVNNSYIIVLKDDVPESVKNTHMNFLLAAHGANPLVGDDGAGLTHVYEPHFNGYAGRFSSEVVDQLRRMPEVAYVERDQIVRTQDIQKAAPWVSWSYSSSALDLLLLDLGSCTDQSSQEVDVFHFHKV